MTQSPLSEVAQRALEREGQQNELRVAVVRLGCYAAATLVTFVFVALGDRSLSEAAVFVAATLMGACIVAGVRSSYAPWLPFAVPLLDVLGIGALLSHRISVVGITTGTAASTTAICALFAATGGLRFDRRSALWTTMLATLLCLWLLRVDVGTSMAYVLAALIGIGLLTIWQGDVIRRMARGEQGRALLRRLLPSTVVDRVFADPSTLDAAPEKVEVTVMVTDLRGFTALSETLAPEALVELLNELHGTLAEQVDAHGGAVDKFMGDGMLAVFGAPRPLTRHAARAVEAAQASLREVERINRRHPDRPPLRIGIGLHTGPVVSGVIGGGKKAEFTVVGDTVNIASRLEAMTKEFDVPMLLSAETADRSGGGPFEAPGEVAIRGRQKSLRVCTPVATSRGTVQRQTPSPATLPIP